MKMKDSKLPSFVHSLTSSTKQRNPIMKQLVKLVVVSIVAMVVIHLGLQVATKLVDYYVSLSDDETSTSDPGIERKTTMTNDVENNDVIITTASLSTAPLPTTISDQPVVTSKQVTPSPELNLQFEKCCQKKQLNDGFSKLCNYGISSRKLKMRFMFGRYKYENLHVLFSCASNGHNNVECCKKDSTIPSTCHPMCLGADSFKLDFTLLECADHFATILQCHLKGL